MRKNCILLTGKMNRRELQTIIFLVEGKGHHVKPFKKKKPKRKINKKLTTC